MFSKNKIPNGRVFLFDGAMGTLIHSSGVSAGACNEEINLSSPEKIAKIHRAYLNAGADIITTNTFGASRVSLADHGLEKKAAEINRAAVQIARREADRASTSDYPRLVAGEMGPTSKLPTLGAISFDELFDAYLEQSSALLDSGADLILIATSQDPLQAKTAMAAVHESLKKSGRMVPVIVSVTIEKSGTMLLGTEITAALATIAPYKPFAFGMNCATGPDAMKGHLSFLAQKSPFPIICRPNAGIPENIGGRAVYPLGPQEFAEILAGYAREYGITFAGGCCGTTPEHIAALAKKLSSILPHASCFMPRASAVSSLYESIDLDQEPRPFIVAEQTNVNGSKKFREFLLSENFDAMAEMAREASRSSHALDICVAFAGRNERSDIAEFTKRVAGKSKAALMIDSTNPDTIEAALKLIPGRSIINSINLEDGGARARRILEIARRFGSVVVALTIDEKGMAKRAAGKLSVAKRLADLAVSEGLTSNDILIDPLTFTLASGDAALKSAGLETLDAIRSIKKEIKGARTILGVSNISFGLPPAGRRVLTSAFLHMAIEAGLDAAIINPAKIIPLHMIPGDDLDVCRRIIMNGASRGDPLKELIGRFAGRAVAKKSAPERAASPEEGLKKMVIEGRAEGIETLTDALVREMEPAEIINGILLPAMHEVGKLFGDCKLPLPFVLESAEAMRAAIDALTPHMEKSKLGEKGTIVLATVRGDVHDIGKNLVDAILSNNNFRVINLGIRQTAEAIIEAARAHNADAIGLSGLLVSSTEVMREDMEAFRQRGITVPVLCGGAALTQSFTENFLARSYGRKVYYCADAFAGLVAMEEIAKK